MHHFLQERPPWYLVGPAFGLVVVGVYWTLNRQVGVLGGFSALVERATGRASTLGWKAWFLLGVGIGGLVYAVLAGSWGATGYTWLTRTFTGPSNWMIGVILFAAGILIGFGAKVAGGCTSGNGLAGCSFGARSSFVATCTFFAVAVGGSFIIRALGGS